MKGKMIALEIISMFLVISIASAIASPLTVGKISTNIKDADKNQYTNCKMDDDFYTGKMTIFAGDFPLYDNWQITVDPNPNFGGSDKKFIMEHGVCSITVTADYEIKGDCPFDISEIWDFMMYLNTGQFLTSFNKEDTPVIDDSCNGTLSATIGWCPLSDYPDFSDGVLPISIGIFVDYRRDNTWHTVEKYTRTVDVVAENEPPSPPMIEGPKTITWKILRDKNYPVGTFNLTSTDPDGDTIEYGWECSNGNFFNWEEKECLSGESYSLNITFYNFQEYTIRARARDTYFCNSFEEWGTAGWSDWSEPFTVKISRPRLIDNILVHLVNHLSFKDIFKYYKFYL